MTIFWLVGLWFSDTTWGASLPNWAWAGASFLSFLISYGLRKLKPSSHLLFACLSLFCMGVLRAHLANPALSPQHIVHLNDKPRSVTLVGKVLAEPDVRDTFINLRVNVDAVKVRTLENPEGVMQTVEGVVLVRTLRFPEIAYGSQVSVTGKLETPFESPEFSYKEFLAREGIYSTMNARRVRVSAENQGNPLYASLLQFKNNANDTITTIVPAPESGVLQSMLFGDRSALTKTLLDDYRTVGLAHTIVVSGFHVSIIMLLVLGLAQLFTTPKRALALTAIVLIVYAVLVGLKAAVIRATIMSLAYLFGQVWLGRRTSSLAILGLVAFGLTAYDPTYLTSVSFQLSFAATLGIILYTEPFSGWLKKQLQAWTSEQFVKRYAEQFITILAMSISAQLLTLPLVAWHFEQVSLISIFANLLIVPIQPLIMILGSLATLIGTAFEPLGQLFGWLVWLPLRYTTATIELLARVPYASLPVEISTFSASTLYFTIATLSWYHFQDVERQIEIWERVMVNVPERSLAGGSALAALLVFGWHGSQPDGMLHVTFFDVGQGDATLIETPSGRQILIDGGYFPSVMSSHLGRAVPFWDRDIDIVIVTHPDADHVAGIPKVLERYRVGRLLVDGLHENVAGAYAAMLDEAQMQNLSPEPVRAGQLITIEDGVQLEIVHPGETLSDESRNNNSVSMRLLYGEFSLLLTGDSEVSAENEILARDVPLQSLVYKAGHHGSGTSSTPAFLEAVNPQIVVISAGENNRFGHPHPDVLKSFATLGATVLCTSQFGSIEVISDGQQMWWEAAQRPNLLTGICVHQE
ncbi:MAG: DNA internalization-related competence protein ComEC/Rec2 [Candidatus Promineifilaceae bacterium]